MSVTRPLVLIVDDAVEATEVLAVLVELVTGWETITAYNGLEALNVALMRRPRVIILDIDMPVMSGIEAALVIRRNAWKPAPLMIAVTGALDLEAISGSGLFDHSLRKPVDIDALAAIIRSADAAQP